MDHGNGGPWEWRTPGMAGRYPLISLWNFAAKLAARKLESWGESCMILTSTIFEWSTRVTDRQKDGGLGDSI